MTVMSEELLEALEADETGDLDAIIEQRPPENFDALRSLLTLDPTVEASHRAKAIYALGRGGIPPSSKQYRVFSRTWIRPSALRQ
jgi:hypothetical protein